LTVVYIMREVKENRRTQHKMIFRVSQYLRLICLTVYWTM
jgi:hypothetical protein